MNYNMGKAMNKVMGSWGKRGHSERTVNQLQVGS